jgi:hypothetical protein
MRLSVAAAIALVALFVASRVALLITSYDVNVNWEEPVFLFSGLELARDGLRHVFDHQDDLNHGGSVALLVLAVPWISTVGTSLLTLKGLEIVWSALTLIAFLVLGWRHWSPRVALFFGLCFVLASPTLARLNVTLVGSHPESLLPAALALSAYRTWARCRRQGADEPAWAAFLLGLWSGLAVWISYVAALFVVPALAMRVASGGGWRRRAFVGAGLLVGALPWSVQNLWLRPHGAGLWRAHLTADAPRDLGRDAGRLLVELAASFGWSPPGGELLLAACGAALLALTVALVVGRGGEGTNDRAMLVPFVAAPYVGFAMLLAARISPSPGEGYYYDRFYVALQVAFFWVLALALDDLARRTSAMVVTGAAVAVAAGALAGQVQLLDRGTSYTPDLAKDRERGCLVFGLAECDRSPDWASAIARLASIRDRPCRTRAFGGLGWGIANEFLARRDVGAAKATLESIPDEGLRWASCGGFHFLVTKAPVSSLTPADYAAAWAEIQTVCHRPQP